MKKRNVLILFYPWILLVVSCATTSQTVKPVKPIIWDEETFQASYEKVWGSVIATVAEQALPIDVIEKESGLLTTKFITIDVVESEAKRMIENPSSIPLLTLWGSIRYTVNFYIHTVGENQTRVKVTSYVQRQEIGSSGQWYVCYSKGVIENDILASIRSKINVR